jgi:hypothetical protein
MLVKEDTDQLVRLHAMKALSRFGRQAAPALPVLREVVSGQEEVESVRRIAEKTIQAIAGGQ